MLPRVGNRQLNFHSSLLPCFFTRPISDRGQECFLRERTPKTDLSVTDTSSWDYRSQSMALSLSLNCSTRKSSALTLLLLKNFWHRDSPIFLQAPLYTRNGRRSAEWQHIGRWADKDKHSAENRKTAANSHYWQEDLRKYAWDVSIVLAAPFIGRSARLQLPEMSWVQCRAQNPVCHGSRQLCTSLLHSGKA